MIGEHFWREPPQENESRTMIGLFGERNVCRFEAAVCGEERCVTTLKTAAKETRRGHNKHKTCERLLIKVEVTFSYFSLKYYQVSQHLIAMIVVTIFMKEQLKNTSNNYIDYPV